MHRPKFCIGCVMWKAYKRKHIVSTAHPSPSFRRRVVLRQVPPSPTSHPPTTYNEHAKIQRDAHAMRVEAVAESYLNVGGICCLVL